MSSTLSGYRRSTQDHFEPQDDNPLVQKRLRGHLEQIDYTAFASNREILAQTLGKVDMAKFQRLAVSTAHARAHWVAEGVALSEQGAHGPSEEAIARLTALRTTYEEFSAVYEAMRRIVERGYAPLPNT